jgi:hypothetical protein
VLAALVAESIVVYGLATMARPTVLCVVVALLGSIFVAAVQAQEQPEPGAAVELVAQIGGPGS